LDARRQKKRAGTLRNQPKGDRTKGAEGSVAGFNNDVEFFENVVDHRSLAFVYSILNLLNDESHASPEGRACEVHAAAREAQDRIWVNAHHLLGGTKKVTIDLAPDVLDTSADHRIGDSA